MTDDDLEAIDPGTALEMYLADRDAELAESTIASHQRRLSLFVQWCDENDIESLSELTPRDLHEFRVWRQQGIRVDGVAPDTLRSALVTTRLFLRWAAGINAVDPNIPELIEVPDSVAKRSRDEMLEPERAEQLLEHLETYEWASAGHVIIELLYRTGMRAGSLRALDVGDYNREEQHLALRHRPETGTPLKNKRDGERLVALQLKTCRILDDWIEDRRPDVEDNGRIPMIATAQGRRSRNSLRRITYYSTLPCHYGECPHDKDPDECEWTGWRTAMKCPSSRSTHPIRRGAITHHLRKGVPVNAISLRADVTPDIIEKHYNQMTEREAMEARREYFE
ncbi:Site-specific recombinase XerD [Halovenus aranensis]|uniref:Site-specific recombinase XerD n=1 Tax=Halovenus aranensis TaxID=890420 RepID=A0A1G8X9S5_9EURY|nr:tyrosine-type recombinase/integrase [Halovenus aranensis]SDJ86500.1 Site-specific recombinase XerD [Halovenus aranensis]